MADFRLTKRRKAIAVTVVASALIALWCVWPRGFTVKIVNRTTGAMTQVRLILRDGTQVELASIDPGKDASAVVSQAQASLVQPVYVQPDGVTNDLVRTVSRPWINAPLQERKVVLAIMSHMMKNNPRSMRYSISQRSILDPAKYLPFAPGAGD